MKWPQALILVRHAVSAYNVLKGKKELDPLYRKFKDQFERHPDSKAVKELARQVWKKHALGMGDADTPLAEEEKYQAQATGQALKVLEAFLPDVVFISPYQRTKETFELVCRGWPELADVRIYEEERLREQEHGLANLYNDWRIFHALHPEQRLLYNQEGPYWYRYTQGESVPDVRERLRSWTNTLVREFSEKKVLVLTHHLAILSLRANLERLPAKEFLRLDKMEKPINCGVTIYRGEPESGRNGRLALQSYNLKLY